MARAGSGFLRVAAAAGFMAGCGHVDAAMITFYSATPNGTVGTLTDSYNFGTVTATAGQMGGGTPKTLTVANFSYPNPNEVGLGVCSSGDTGSLCTSPPATVKVNQASSLWDGNITEIDNLGNNDLLNLTVAAGNRFTGEFILGSLDTNGGTSNFEDGYITFGTNTVRFSRTAAGAAVTSGNATITQAGAGYGADVFFLTLMNFDPNITQVTFGAGGTGNSGTNNDYLVAAAGVTPVPLPATLWLLGSGLALFRASRRARTAGPGSRS